MQRMVRLIATCVMLLVQAELAAQLQPGRATPVLKGRGYVITLGNQQMIVDPARGGRIVSLLLNGEDFLTDSTVNDFNWGSTFWLSPQRDWHWPPSAEIDNKPYKASVENNALVMVSAPDRKTGLVVTKTIFGEPGKQAFVLQYTITNRSAASQKIAPWEVTRVKPDGMAFFPAGQGAARGGLLPLTTLQHGVFWFAYDKQKLPLKGDRQLYADGAEGWLAQVNGKQILVKQFPNILPGVTAPEEGEVELYASEVSPASPGYVEIEHQGAYVTLPPGASVTWTCTWFFRNLPAHIQPAQGNAALAAWVRKLIETHEK
jgi:hypothetical protein